eukprot:tig00001085_g6953.t1
MAHENEDTEDPEDPDENEDVEDEEADGADVWEEEIWEEAPDVDAAAGGIVYSQAIDLTDANMWDDSALIKAFDESVAKYQIAHKLKGASGVKNVRPGSNAVVSEGHKKTKEKREGDGKEKTKEKKNPKDKEGGKDKEARKKEKEERRREKELKKREKEEKKLRKKASEESAAALPSDGSSPFGTGPGYPYGWPPEWVAYYSSFYGGEASFTGCPQTVSPEPGLGSAQQAHAAARPATGRARKVRSTAGGNEGASGAVLDDGNSGDDGHVLFYEDGVPVAPVTSSASAGRPVSHHIPRKTYSPPPTLGSPPPPVHPRPRSAASSARRPPAGPDVFGAAEAARGQQEAFSRCMLAWYYAGFYAGQYQAQYLQPARER